MLHHRSFVAFAALAFVGCSGAPEDAAEVSTEALTESSLLAECPRPLPAADRTRKAVISHPFGDNPNRYEVLNLATNGNLTRAGVNFEMGRANSFVPIVFTPDGKVGLVAQDSGTIGVFRFESNGRVTVVDPAWSGGFSVRALTMDPNGTRVFAVSADTEENGGGVYEVAIACDGHLQLRGRAVPGGQANAMTFLPTNPKKAVLFAGRAFGSEPPTNTFLLDVGATTSVAAKGDSFGDMDAIASSIGVTPDGKYALIGDDSLTAGNRVAVVALPSMQPKQLLSTRAPFSIVTSPWNNAAIVVNGDDSDTIEGARYDANNTTAPFRLTGPISGPLPGALLPGVAVQVSRGGLKGRVLVAELLAVRQLQFSSAGGVREVSQLDWGKTTENIVGTIGLQP